MAGAELASAATITDFGDFKPYAINDAGQIAGSEDVNFGNYGYSRAYEYSGGVLTYLGGLGGPASAPYGINNAGQIVGIAYVPDGQYLPFLYQNGNLTRVGSYDWATAAKGINNSGQIIINADNGHAFLYSNGVMTDLGSLGKGDTLTFAINDAGQVVGQSETNSLNFEAFLYTNGVMTDLGKFGGNQSVAYDINNAGQVVGAAIKLESAFGDFDGNEAFLYSNGVSTDLGIGLARSINNAGQTVGNASLSAQQSEAFLYSDGVRTDLQSLLPANSGWTNLGVREINNSGQIIGVGTFQGETQQGFLIDLTIPAPEPRSWELFCAAGLLLGMILRKASVI